MSEKKWDNPQEVYLPHAETWLKQNYNREYNSRHVHSLAELMASCYADNRPTEDALRARVIELEAELGNIPYKKKIEPMKADSRVERAKHAKGIMLNSIDKLRGQLEALTAQETKGIDINEQ